MSRDAQGIVTSFISRLVDAKDKPTRQLGRRLDVAIKAEHVDHHSRGFNRGFELGWKHAQHRHGFPQDDGWKDVLR
jgi:hypothetical protein